MLGVAVYICGADGRYLPREHGAKSLKTVARTYKKLVRIAFT